MAYSPQIDDHDVAGFVPRQEMARSDLKVSAARMHEAPVRGIGHSEFDPEISDGRFGHVRSEPSRHIRLVTARSVVRVAT
ncbi:MAG: hypothetical protein F4X97_15755 [Boseongicola sp. SB0662_bin_57]|nr:hypothetical protein [Boseongicola sp. SB0662_bin_57]